MKTNTHAHTPPNPPAFPFPIRDGLEPEYGMSLRDYFAGQALLSIASMMIQIREDLKVLQLTGDNVPHEVAKASYEIADAMLITRALGNSEKEGA